ncbi:hypothetical protein UCRPC4_g03258 [Phaeomoniella chlamydospora]|uniref:DUF6594 domain-containing protein n=1 Tax=Phaeomoniella chlamydospora TaxID=158046 RepID=A0A0G2H1F4_PHACM|nr:hypothetical protein UCRPC4_g03258 [Phaeomoniella chlamydospora]
MPPTAWRQYDPPHSPLPEPGLSTSSSTDDESGPSSRERSDSSWSHEDPKYPNKEAVRGPYGVVEQPLNFQLGNSKTLEALCGPESQTDERSISQRSDSGDDGDDEVPADVVSSYQSLIPDSPYFEDFDYARPDSNLDDDSGDLRGRPAESGRKTVRFESYESFKTARSEPDDDVPAMEIDQCYDFSHDVPVVNGQWQASSFTGTKHPSRASVKIEPVSVPPIPTIPAQHRNASPIPSSSVSSTRSSSFSGPVIPPGKYPPGHQLVSTADLAAFNNSKTEVLLFRRFDSVHKRILNDMQDRIVTLEAELSQLDQFLSDSTDVLTSDQNQKQPNSGQLGPEGGIARARSRRLTVIHDLKSSLRDYDDLLLKFNSLRIPPGNDQKTSINKFKTWLTKNGPTPPPPNPTNSSMPSSGSTTPTNAKPSTTTMSNNNNTTSSSLTFPFFHPSPPSSRPNSSSSTISTTTRPTSANPSSSSSQPPTYLPVRAATITPSTTTSSASAAAAPTQAQAIAQVDPNLKAAAAMVMAGASLGDGKRPRTSRRGVTG